MSAAYEQLLDATIRHFEDLKSQETLFPEVEEKVALEIFFCKLPPALRFKTLNQ